MAPFWAYFSCRAQIGAHVNSETVRTDSGSKAIAVAIVEDLTEIREGIADLLDATAGFRCVGRYGSMEHALAAFAHHPADVALCDIQLPGIDGIEGIRRLKAAHPQTVFIVFSVYDDDERVFDALCAGASGYLLKKTPPERLLEALTDAAAGGGPMSPEIAQRVIKLFRKFAPQRSEVQLTPHEVRLLRLISEGHDYPSAADELSVATSTVVYHMRQIFQKLQVHSKSQAVAQALKAGLLR